MHIKIDCWLTQPTPPEQKVTAFNYKMQDLSKA